MTDSRLAMVLPMTRTPWPPTPSMTMDLAAIRSSSPCPRLLARPVAGSVAGPTRGQWLALDDAELVRLQACRARRGGLVLGAVALEHVVGAGEPDPATVVLDALAGHVDEREARPLDRFLDGLAHGALMVDGRLGVVGVGVRVHQALQIDRRVS